MSSRNRRGGVTPPVLLLILMAPAAVMAAETGPDGGVPADRSVADGAAATEAAVATVDGGDRADAGADRVATLGPGIGLPVAVLPAAPVGPDAGPHRVEELTVLGTRESRTAGSAHVLKGKDLERLDYDNPEQVVKAVPGVYARSEDGMGLRPNIGIRGTSPDRSKKITLMEDGVLFGPAPYSAPAAYFFPQITRMEMVRVIKGPAGVSFGPQTVGGAIDLVTRRVPVGEVGSLDLATGQYGYGKLHAYYGASSGRSGYVIEGVHLRTDGFKQLDGGGDTGFVHNEWMWKGRYQLSNNPNALQEVTLKLGYSDEDSHETYLGLTDADFRANPLRRYRASQLDHMLWHRTQVVAFYRAEFARAFTIDVAAYRHDFSRTWRKVNHLKNRAIADVLAEPDGAMNQIFYRVLTGDEDSASAAETIYVGPNRRNYVSQGIQAIAAWRGLTGPISHRYEASARLHYDHIDRLHTEDGFLMRSGTLVHDGNGTLTTADARAWTNAVALYAGGWSSWGPLTLTPGLRTEFITATVRDRLAGIETARATDTVFIPGIGAHLALTPSLGLFAGAYRGFSPVAAEAEEGAREEYSVNYEAGARWRGRNTRFEAIGFFNDYQNLTSVCSFAQGCVTEAAFQQYNAGRVYIWGAELLAQVNIPVGRRVVFPLSGTYTLTRTRLRDTYESEDPTLGNVTAGDEMPYVPHHQAMVSAAIDTPFASLTCAATYVSAMREQAGHGEIPSGLRTDESFLLDVTARAFIGRHGQVYLQGRNILDADDLASRRPFGARPVAPRWIQVGTKWNF